MALTSPRTLRPRPGASTFPVGALARLCAALADPTRLRILSLLRDGEVCVCDIHGSLGVPQPTASRHLSYLRRHGLVTARKDGLWVHYKRAEDLPPPLAAIVESAVNAASETGTAAADTRRRMRTTARPQTSASPQATGCCPTSAPRG